MNGFYRLGYILTGAWLRLGGMKIIGKENIPQDKSLLIIANHTSFGDPVVLSNAFPYHITYIAKEEFLHNKFTKFLFGTVLGCTFLKKDEGDLGAMRVTMKALADGKAVGIFPEGKRNFDQELSEFKSGAAYIAFRAKAKVLPVAIINSGDFFRFWKRNIRVLIGTPIEMPEGQRPDKEMLLAYTQKYYQQIEDLLQQGKTMLAEQGKSMRKVPKSKQK